MIKEYFGIQIMLNNSYGYAMKYRAYINNHFLYGNTISEIKHVIKELLRK